MNPCGLRKGLTLELNPLLTLAYFGRLKFGNWLVTVGLEGKSSPTPEFTYSKTQDGFSH